MELCRLFRIVRQQEPWTIHTSYRTLPMNSSHGHHDISNQRHLDRFKHFSCWQQRKHQCFWHNWCSVRGICLWPTDSYENASNACCYDSLVQGYSISIANALTTLQSCTKPWGICFSQVTWLHRTIMNSMKWHTKKGLNNSSKVSNSGNCINV